jgi:formylglycine-generating enzyme required for sulfatase activity
MSVWTWTLLGVGAVAVFTGAAMACTVSIADVHNDGGSGGGGGCPQGQGPDMVQVPVPSGGGTFCIDSTEVRVRDYEAFVLNPPPVSSQDPGCLWNTDFTPSFQDTNLDNPVTNVNWCDAIAFCKWAGKRLCGRIGGGSNPQGQFADPTTSQWYAACSAGGTLAYPYGNTPEDNACNTWQTDAGDTNLVSVKSFAGCVGGYPGIFDMSGNAAEWEDSCAQGQCFTRGGSFVETPENVGCAGYVSGGGPPSPPDTSAMDGGSDLVGFRCCSP